MRRGVVVCSLIIVYVIMSLTGCSSRRDYEYLQSVDTISNVCHDSAYTMLETMDFESLSLRNKAYYALLYTSARYKQYLPIEDDSLISIAVDYYTDNFDQQMLIRALMIKGGVLSDIGFNRLALECYKAAEEIIDTTDYLTCGLLNTRFGELYQKSYITNDEDIARYK